MVLSRAYRSCTLSANRRLYSQYKASGYGFTSKTTQFRGRFMGIALVCRRRVNALSPRSAARSGMYNRPILRCTVGCCVIYMTEGGRPRGSCKYNLLVLVPW